MSNLCDFPDGCYPLRGSGVLTIRTREESLLVDDTPAAKQKHARRWLNLNETNDESVLFTTHTPPYQHGGSTFESAKLSKLQDGRYPLRGGGLLTIRSGGATMLQPLTDSVLAGAKGAGVLYTFQSTVMERELYGNEDDYAGELLLDQTCTNQASKHDEQDSGSTAGAGAACCSSSSIVPNDDYDIKSCCSDMMMTMSGCTFEGMHAGGGGEGDRGQNSRDNWERSVFGTSDFSAWSDY